MSLPRPSGIKQPTRISRPSGLPTTRPQTPSGGNSTNQHSQNNGPGSNTKAQSAIAKSARGVGFCPEHADQYATDVSRAFKGPDPLEDGIVTDDFKIGDRIWVSGNKPGTIAFIGETQFAPGDWAGIVLDDGIGKNDGSVMGIRYFQCEPKRGVFSRLSKLSHSPHSPSRPLSQGYDSNSSESKCSYSDFRPSPQVATNGTSAPGSAASSRPSSRLGLSSSKHLSTSSSSLHKASDITTPPGSAGSMKLPGASLGGTKLGDRVLVSGSKPGILRFIGETDFAKGVWAGVELDEPLGKNDGAVAGKRYFDCKPLHGLFAPIHKVSLADLGVTTPSPHSRPVMSTSLRSSRERSGSQESVSSLSSTASSVSRSRVRLGVTSLASQASKTGQRPNTLNLSATTAALQKALKEKEEHIEQLLRERDMERSEVARAAAHVDEAESQLSFIKTEQSKLRMEADDQISKYRALVADLENEKQELLAFLEEEKRKVEDLQFQLEEETLKDDADSKPSAASELQVKELERQVKKEKDRADNLEKELSQLKQSMESLQKAVEESRMTQRSYSDQIENLTHKLAQAESKAKKFELNRLEDGAKVGQVSIELTEKQNQVKELEEQLVLQRREKSSVSQQLNDLREELFASNEKRKKQDEYIKELTDKLKLTENQHNEMMDEIRNANSNSADLQRQLTASKTKAEELASERAILETQLSELMKNSGDSSSQLATLNAQIMDRTRKLEDLQNDLLNSSQKLAKTEESYQGAVQEKDREIQEITKHFQDRIVKLEDEISELNSFIEKSKAKANQLSESFESEKREALERRESEVRELQQQLLHTNNELNKQQDNTTAHKQLLEKISQEKEALQYEKMQAEKHLRRAEEEKSSINTELIQARVEASKHLEEVEKSKRVKLELEDKVEKLSLQVEFITKAKDEAEKSKEEVKSQKTELVQENNLLKQELGSLRGVVQKKDTELEEMENMVEKLQSEASRKVEDLMYKSQTEADHLTQELVSLKSLLQETQDQLKSKDDQVSELQALLDNNTVLIQERESLEKEKAELIQEKEATEDKCRSFLKEVEKQSYKATELQSEVHTLKSSQEALKQQKSALEGKVVQLETDLDQARRSAAEALSTATAVVDQSGSSGYLQLKEETEFAMQQVDFLNSVIVELQKKNQELQTRLSVMEDSGIHTNGELGDVVETATHKRVPPRMFCDICDVFDLHDTEDCPRQATSSSPEPTRHHGERISTRPYCGICEVFSELCQCGAFSSQNKAKRANSDISLGITVLSSTSSTDKSYQPPEEFSRERKQHCNERMFQTVESSFDDLHGKSENLNEDPGDTQRCRDYCKYNSMEMLSPLIDTFFPENKIELSATHEDLPAEIICHSTTQKPDLLQGCYKTVPSLVQTRCYELILPDSSVENKQDLSTSLQDRDKTKANLFQTGYNELILPDSSLASKQDVNKLLQDCDKTLAYLDEASCNELMLSDSPGETKQKNTTLLRDSYKTVADVFQTSYDELDKPDSLVEIKQENTTLVQDSNKPVPDLFQTNYEESILPHSSTENHQDLNKLSQNCDKTDLFKTSRGNFFQQDFALQNKHSVNSPDTGFFDDDGEIDLPLTHETGWFDNVGKDIFGKWVDMSRKVMDPLENDSWSPDITNGVTLEACKDFSESSLDTLGGCMCIGSDSDNVSWDKCGYLSNSLFYDSVNQSPEGCDPGSFVDDSQDTHSGSGVDATEGYNPSSVVDASESYNPSSVVDASESYNPSIVVDASEIYNPSIVVDASESYNPSSVVDASESYNSSSVVGALEDVGPGFLFDVLDGCDPSSLVDAPEGYGSIYSTDVLDGFNPGSLFDIPEITDSDCLFEGYDGCFLFDSSEDCGVDFVSDAPKGSSLGCLFDIPEECDPVSLIHGGEVCDPASLIHTGEVCDPVSLISAEEKYDPVCLLDALDSCDISSLFDNPEGVDLKNVETTRVNQVAQEKNTDCCEDLVPLSFDQVSMDVSPKDANQTTLEIHDLPKDTVGDVSVYHIADRTEGETEIQDFVGDAVESEYITGGAEGEIEVQDFVGDAVESEYHITGSADGEAEIQDFAGDAVESEYITGGAEGEIEVQDFAGDAVESEYHITGGADGEAEIQDVVADTVDDVSRYLIKDTEDLETVFHDFAGNIGSDVTGNLPTNRADPETRFHIAVDEGRDGSRDFTDESTGVHTIKVDLYPVNQVYSRNDNALESSVGTSENNSLSNSTVHEIVIHENVFHEDDIHENVIHGDDIHEDDIHENAIHEHVIHENIIHENAIHENIIHENAIHENAIHENIIHENESHENVSHENVSHENIIHENVSHENVIHENIIHENVSHENVIHENIIHENVSHENIIHENVSHENIIHENVIHEDVIHEKEKESVFKRYFSFAKDFLGGSGKQSKIISDHELHTVESVSGAVVGESSEQGCVDPPSGLPVMTEGRKDVSCGFADVFNGRVAESVDSETKFQMSVEGIRNVTDFMDASSDDIIEGLDHETEFQMSVEGIRYRTDFTYASSDDVIEGCDHETEFQISDKGNQDVTDAMDASSSDLMANSDPEFQISVEGSRYVTDSMDISRDGMIENSDPETEFQISVEGSRCVTDSMDTSRDGMIENSDPETEFQIAVEEYEGVTGFIAAARDDLIESSDSEFQITVERNQNLTNSMDLSDAVIESSDSELQITVERNHNMTNSMDLSDAVIESSDSESQISVEVNRDVTASMLVVRDGVTGSSHHEADSQISVKGNRNSTDSIDTSRDGVMASSDPEFKNTEEVISDGTGSVDLERCQQDKYEADCKDCANHLKDALNDNEIGDENGKPALNYLTLEAESLNLVEYFNGAASDCQMNNYTSAAESSVQVMLKNNCPIDSHACGSVSVVDTKNRKEAIVHPGESSADRSSVDIQINTLLACFSVSADAKSTNDVANYEDRLADASQDYCRSNDSGHTSQLVFIKRRNFMDGVVQASKYIEEVGHDSTMITPDKCGSSLEVLEDFNFKGVSFGRDAGAMVQSLESYDLEKCETEINICEESPRSGSETKSLEYEQMFEMDYQKQLEACVVDGSGVCIQICTPSDCQEVVNCDKDSLIELTNIYTEDGDLDWNVSPCVSLEQEATSDQVCETVLGDSKTRCPNECKDVHFSFKEAGSQFSDWSQAASASSNMAFSDLQAMKSGHSDSAGNGINHNGINIFHQAGADGYTWDGTVKNWEDIVGPNYLSATDVYMASLRDFGITEDSKTAIFHSRNNEDDSDTDSGTSV